MDGFQSDWRGFVKILRTGAPRVHPSEHRKDFARIAESSPELKERMMATCGERIREIAGRR